MDTQESSRRRWHGRLGMFAYATIIIVRRILLLSTARGRRHGLLKIQLLRNARLKFVVERIQNLERAQVHYQLVLVISKKSMSRFLTPQSQKKSPACPENSANQKTQWLAHGSLHTNSFPHMTGSNQEALPQKVPQCSYCFPAWQTGASICKVYCTVAIKSYSN